MARAFGAWTRHTAMTTTALNTSVTSGATPMV